MKKMRIYFFNVGHGDHILLEFPNNEYGIIDFNFSASIGHTKLPAISYFEAIAKKINPKEITIKFILISHPDNDHIKGLDQFLFWCQANKIKINELWVYGGFEIKDYFNSLKCIVNESFEQLDINQQIGLCNLTNTFNESIENLIDYVDNCDINVKFLEDIKPLLGRIGDSDKIQAYSIAPLKRHIDTLRKDILPLVFVKYIFSKNEKINSNKNYLSSVLLIRCGDSNLFFGGDTNSEVWEDCINEYFTSSFSSFIPSLHSDLIKVSHHGSKNSSSEFIWNNLLSKRDSSSQIIFSAGKAYNLPHIETIENIKKASSNQNVKINISSTNRCNFCEDRFEGESESIDWIFENNPKLPVEDSYAVNINRFKPSETHELNDNIIAAYIYDVSIDNKKIKVVEGVAENLNSVRKKSNQCEKCNLYFVKN